MEIKPQDRPGDLIAAHTYLLAADSVAQAGAQHLLAALCLEPLHAHGVDDAVVGDALPVGLGLGLLRLGLVQRRLHVRDAGGARACSTAWHRRDMWHSKLSNRRLPLSAEIIKPQALQQTEGTTLLSFPRRGLIIPLCKF